MATETADVTAALRALPLGFSLTNLEKVLFPESGVKKVHVLAYYAGIAEALLPHIRRRPLTLLRCPDGPSGTCFYQRHANGSVPEAVRRTPIAVAGRAGLGMFVDDLEGLVALGQIGALEIHAWMCHVDELERPDEIVLDIDPDAGLPFERVVEAALLLRERLASVGLASFVKTTGGKGLHVALPVGRRLDWETHVRFTLALVQGLAKEHPDRFVTNARKEARTGKLFLDYLRNGRGATAIAPYSPRARPGPTVATPLAWEELARPLDPSRFTLASVLTRVTTLPDPWREFSTLRQSVTKGALAAVGARITNGGSSAR